MQDGLVERRLADRRAGAASVSRQPAERMSWEWVLGVGLLLFLATAADMLFTGNPNLYPTVTFIGSFLVPVTFVAFLYDHQHWSTLTFEAMVRAFVLGGVLGILGASILEPFLVPHFLGARGGLGFEGALVVAVIEEGSKLAAVAFVARRMRHTGALDGLLLGAAVGMGFAALESSGYAFTVLLATGGNVPASLIETVVRGLFAPFGHGVWTAIAGAALFAGSSASGYRWSRRLWLALAFVILLHAAWDGLSTTRLATLPFGVPLSGSMAGVAVAGLVVLGVLFRLSIRQQRRLESEGRLPPPVPR